MEPESKKQTIDNEHPETNQQNQQQHTNTDESVEESSNNNINNSTMSMSGSSSRNVTMSGSDTMMNESEASSSVSNISKRREKARTEINRNFLVCLFNILLLDETFNKIASFNNDSSAFFLWVSTHLSENQHVKELISLSKRKADKRMSPHTKATSSLHDNEDIVLQELGTGQIKQILRAAYSLVIFAKNDARIETIFTFAIMENCASSYFVNAGSYLSLVLDGKRATKTMSKSSVLELSAPSNLEVLIYFHCVNYLTNGSDRIKKSSVTATRLGYAVQTVLYCWTRMAKNIKIEHDGKLSTLLMPYILYQSEKGVFDVIDTKSKGFATTQQTRSFDNIYATVQEREVDPIAFNLSEDIDKALRFIIRMMFNELHTIVKKQFLYVCSEKDLKEWEDLEKFRLPSSETDIPQVFTDLPDDVCTALGVTKPEPQSEVLEVIVVSDVDEELEIQPTVKGDTGGKRKQIGGEEERLMKKKQRVEADNEITSAKIIKEEPIHEIEPGNSTKLSTSADNAFDTLNAEMCSRFGLFDCAFTDLEEEVQDAMGVDLENQVDLLLTDPPYGTRKELKKPNSGHDELTAEDMKNFAKFAGRVLKPGGHGIIFCSDLQFKDWFLTLSKIREEEPDYEADDSGAVMKSVAKFKVESISLNFIRAPGYYQSNPVRNNLTHASVVERAIHFWRRGESLSEERKKVDYASTSSSSSTYPGWTNVVTNVQRPTAEEIVYMKDNNENGNAANRIMVRPEQKGILWMSNLIEKFSKPGDLVVDCFSGTFSVAKACFLLSKHRRFIGCDKDPVCLERTEDKLIEIFARQLLNPRSDIS
ncbi:MAG: DNA methyltransferase, partial [Bacteroidota bacterium]